MTVMWSVLSLSLVATGLWSDMRRGWITDPAEIPACEYYQGRHRAGDLLGELTA